MFRSENSRQHPIAGSWSSTDPATPGIAGESESRIDFEVLEKIFVSNNERSTYHQASNFARSLGLKTPLPHPPLLHHRQPPLQMRLPQTHSVPSSIQLRPTRL